MEFLNLGQFILRKFRETASFDCNSLEVVTKSMSALLVNGFKYKGAMADYSFGDFDSIKHGSSL